MEGYKTKRGVSPVIATVLLIGIVIILALTIFLWFKNFTKEAVIKFDKNIELVCDEVQFDADYSDGTLTLSNYGNVPVFKIKVRVESEGNYETRDITEFTDLWPKNGLTQGGSFSDIIDFGVADRVVLIPVLVGKTEKGEKRTFTCDENRYGYEIVI